MSWAGLRAMVMDAARRIRTKGGTISVDPNLRAELGGHADALCEILNMTDLFMPAGDELLLFDAGRDKGQVITALLTRGKRTVVVKRGAQGASVHEAGFDAKITAISVTEVDPNAAGNSFGGAFLSCWLNDLPPFQALRLANAAGARAVTVPGPMEGTSTRQELDMLLA